MPDYLKFAVQLSYWSNPYFWTLIAVLASYRLSHILVTDVIGSPVRRLFRVREDFDQDLQPNFVAKVLSCYWCTSVWVSLFVFLFMVFLLPVILVPFGIAGAALFMEELNYRD